tara:strand:+ start:50 stop:1261 length:1212 start_codon:yes stop_codon:yes gene_type:complete
MNKIAEKFSKYYYSKLQELKINADYKKENIITSKQSSLFTIKNKKNILNLCSNNYLGLSNNKILESTAKKSINKYGYGMASVRFICGTQEIHKKLEKKISNFLKMEDTILYSSCFDANTGLFETILNEKDAIISDELNHASIIDGIRLCKAKKFRYLNNNMSSLEEQLQLAKKARYKLIATDGVFSMDGIIADLKNICSLAEEYGAMVMVDDSHAFGFIGKNGRGSIEHCKVEGRVNIVTGTLGKALGGASGGFTSGNSIFIDWLRQRSRPYLFSNTLAPVIAATSLKALELIKQNTTLRKKLLINTRYFRKEMIKLGFKLSGSNNPIVPIMIGNSITAQKMAIEMIKRGIYVVNFSFPVVPKNKARIRVQISAQHTLKDINKAIETFAKVGQDLNIIRKESY